MFAHNGPYGGAAFRYRRSERRRCVVVRRLTPPLRRIGCVVSETTGEFVVHVAPGAESAMRPERTDCTVQTGVSVAAVSWVPAVAVAWAACRSTSRATRATIVHACSKQSLRD